MPKQDNRKFNTIWYFSTCYGCEDEILKNLTKGTQLSSKMNKCDTYVHSHIGNKSTVKVAGWYSCNVCVWKLTNDSRRDIIRHIFSSRRLAET